VIARNDTIRECAECSANIDVVGACRCTLSLCAVCGDTEYSSAGDGFEDSTVVIRDPEGSETLLPLRLDVQNHSPTGFSWGYYGSGPAQLALAICCDALGDERGSKPECYMKFKDEVVARIPQGKPWALCRALVITWARSAGF